METINFNNIMVESRARLKKLFDSEGSVRYTIVSDLVVLPDYSIGVKDD
jgi:hypothetical protein